MKEKNHEQEPNERYGNQNSNPGGTLVTLIVLNQLGKKKKLIPLKETWDLMKLHCVCSNFNETFAYDNHLIVKDTFPKELCLHSLPKNHG
jgi:hypothetical protein